MFVHIHTALHFTINNVGSKDSSSSNSCVQLSCCGFIVVAIVVVVVALLGSARSATLFMTERRYYCCCTMLHYVMSFVGYILIFNIFGSHIICIYVYVYKYCCTE